MELLVVITIIGLLASIVLYNFNESRKKARDNIRISELQQIKSALAIYKADTGNYPFESDGFSGGGTNLGIICTDPAVCSTSRMNTPINQVLTEYLGEGVADPLHNEGPGTKYWYYYDGRKSCSNDYVVVTVHATRLEKTENSNVGEISDLYCPNFSDSANEGGGINAGDAHVLIVEYLDSSGTRGINW